MFNLIVTWQGDAWETDQLMRIEAARFDEYSGAEFKENNISLDDSGSLKLLENIPTLLMYEISSEGLNTEIVKYGNVYDIKRSGREITFRFQEKGKIQRDVIQDNFLHLGIDSFEDNRTHWAIKDGDLTQKVKDQIRDTYDIAMSFAGEDREIVSKIANLLEKNNVRVFYDEFEVAILWGKDLYDYFSYIYSKMAKYCIIFISEDYVKKTWTRHEIKMAQARAIEESREYILPVKIDDTEIPSIPKTIGYLDVRQISPEEIANLTLIKLGVE